jgi:hypothetical protein
MVVLTCPQIKPQASCDDGFLKLMPVVERHARVVFRSLPDVDREEAVAETVAAAFVAYRRLRERGIDPVHEFPSMMATFAVKYVRNGRHVGSRSTSKDVLSVRAQRRHGFRVQSLPMTFRRSQEELYGEVRGQARLDVFEERLVDNRQTPPADQAAFRIDFAEFVRSLSVRDQRLAEFLSVGHSNKAAAERFHLSPGRITQLRQGWCENWYTRIGEETAWMRDRRTTNAQHGEELNQAKAS